MDYYRPKDVRLVRIGHNTVRTHQRRIYEKLHVQSRTEAAMKFAQRERGPDNRI